MTQFDVSFIIIEYLCLEDLKNCINSIHEKCIDISYEIIVSSNSLYSAEKKTSLLNNFSGTKWIFNEKNYGFAKAMNIGIINSTGNCVVIINPDVILREGSLHSAYEFFTTQANIGIIGPKIIDTDGNLQDSCRKFMTPLDLFMRAFKRIFFRKDVLLDSKFNYDKIQQVDWIIGAFMMVKRDVLGKVGLLDEGYFLYVEDMDWCKRFWDNGFEVIYYPELVVVYKGDKKSTSFLISRNILDKYTLYHLKGYLRFLKKHKLFFSS